MQKTKSFIQYKGDSFSIRVKIGITGNISQKSHLYFYGKYYKEISKKWYKQDYKKNKNKIQARRHIHYNKEKNKEIYKNNIEYYKKYSKEYRKTDKWKEIIKRSNARRRDLEFNPLNNPFENCEGHHIDKTNVIFIPKEIHRSISHNIWTGRNMHEINTLAIDYYWEERFKKYGVIK